MRFAGYMHMNDKILNLLNKLLRQENGERELGNEEAAQRFGEKVQDLLKRYSLSMDDVTSSDAASPEPVNHTLFTINENKKTCAWQSVLLNGVAQANNCTVLNMYKSNKYFIIGTETNRTVVMRLFVYFSDLAEHLANKERTTRAESVRFRNGYLYGFASGLAKRMIAASEAVTKEAEEHRKQLPGVSNALIRIGQELAEIRNYENKEFPASFEINRPVKFNLSGFHFGQKAAAKVAMTSQTMKASV